MDLPLENLRPLIRCPSCQKKFDPGMVALLSEDDQRTTLHLSCDTCGVSSLIFVSMGKMGVVSFGMLTDLDRDEARRLYGSDPISSDEALSEYAFLRSFDGSMSEYLSSKNGFSKR